MAAESDLLGVMVIAAWTVHSETAKGMKYSASRYLAYLMRNPKKHAHCQQGAAPAAPFLLASGGGSGRLGDQQGAMECPRMFNPG